MAGGSTTVAIGSVNVTTSGTLTNLILQQVATLTAGVTDTTVPAAPNPGTGGTPVTLPTGAAGQVLTIPSADTGVISVPGGYTAVVYSGSGSLVGGTSTEAIIGNFAGYFGGAGTVIATSTGSTVTGTIVDTTASAAYAIDNAGDLIFGLASDQTYAFDTGFSTVVSTGSVQGSGSKQSVSVDGSASVIGFYIGSTDFTQTGGAETIYAGAGGNTLNASAGNTVFFGSAAGDQVTLGSGTAELINNTGVMTITAGSGADTVFATGGVKYTGGTGQSLFIGGSGMSTVYTAANETMFGGTGGDMVSVANGSNLLFVTNSANDTIQGGTVAPTVWGSTNENLMVTDSVQGGIYILFGNNEQINLMNSGGGSHILGIDGGPFAGNATLTMSNAGNDSVVLFSPNQFGLTSATHTLTIANWQASDLLDLTFATVGNQNFGYSATDASNAQAALASGSSFTLPDGTTVVFQGAKPTTVFHA